MEEEYDEEQQNIIGCAEIDICGKQNTHVNKIHNNNSLLWCDKVACADRSFYDKKVR